MHLIRKHGKTTAEGDALLALREICVLAKAHAIPWEKKLPLGRGRFTIDFMLTTLERLSARSYVDSDRLDLDHLTRNQPSKAA